MRRCLSSILRASAIGLLVGCTPAAPAQRPPVQVSPPSSLPEIGWALEGALSAYDRESLYQYVNGGAELFLRYGFQRLVSGTYVRGGAADDFVVVDVYDMGSELGAFGVYAAHEGADSSPLQIGAAGFEDAFLLAFYKGRHFVHMTLNTADRARIHRIAEAVARAIPGDHLPPRELAYLPEEFRVRGTLEYSPEALLGHGFLPGGLRAQYLWEGVQITAFVAFCGGDEAADSALAHYWGYLAGAGGYVSEDTGLEGPGLFGEEPGQGYVLAVKRGAFLVGVRGLRDRASAYPIIIGIQDRLTRE